MTPFPVRRRWAPLAFALPLALVVLSGCSSGSGTTTTTTTQASATTTPTTSTTSPAGGETPSTLAGGAVATGSVTCTNVTGTVTFTPPLSNTGTSPETTHISLSATGCTTAGSSASQVTGGTASAVIQSSDNSCVGLTTSKAVAVAVAWSPPSVHASVASFSGYAIVTNAAQHLGFGLPNTKGSVSVTGSFAGTDGGATSTASTYSDLTTAQLLGACGTAAGVATLTVASGTVTLS